MKKIFFLLTALLGVAGIANAQVDFNLTTPADLATNTLSIDKSATATTQEFTVAYGTEDITFVGTPASVEVVDASYNAVTTVASVTKKAGTKNVFTVTLDASVAGIVAGNLYVLSFPASSFQAGTSGEVNKKFGIHLDVAPRATFNFTGDVPSEGKWNQATLTWTIPQEYVTPATLTGTLTSTPAGYAKVGTMPAGLTLDVATGAVTIAKGAGYAATYTIPANSLKVKNVNGSYSYNDAIVLTVNQYVQAVNMTVKDADLGAVTGPRHIFNTTYNPSFYVNTTSDDIRVQFFKPVVGAGNELDNIDRADLVEFKLYGKAVDGTVVDITIPGSEFAYTSTDVHKTFTHALGQKLHAGSYTARMQFSLDNLVILGVDPIEYEYVYCTVDVYQYNELGVAKILNAKALEGEDIYKVIDQTEDVEGLKMNINDKTNVLNQASLYTTAWNKNLNLPTIEKPYVINASNPLLKMDVDNITWDATNGIYKVTLHDYLDAGKGYILTFPAYSLYMRDGEKWFTNSNLVAVNLDIYHGFEFNDVANTATTTSAEVDAKADIYERLHYTRNYNGNFQAAYLPFDLVIDEKVKADFYQINAAYLDEDGTPVLKVNKMPVGKTVKAYLPYIVKGKTAGAVKYTFAGELKAAPLTEGTITTSTAFATYTFTGTKSGNLAGLLPATGKVGAGTQWGKDKDYNFLLMGNSKDLSVLTADQRKSYNQEWTGLDAVKNATIHQWRFWVLADETTGKNQFVDYSKIVIEEDETTGIDSVETTSENGVMFNVAGQRISAPVKGQVYMMNGKKYIAK